MHQKSTINVPHGFLTLPELGFLEYLDHDMRQTKKGKVYTNSFDQNTARRKVRDHSIEILDHSIDIPKTVSVIQ